jgi:serine/alanine adding enzyme
VIVVRKGATTVAGGITIGWRGRTELPWASSLREHLPLCPNMLLYWTAIRRAIAAGHATFDFGRSTPNEGTFHFKRQWGAEPEELCWEYAVLNTKPLPDQSPANPRFGLAIAAWQRLPLWIADRLGPVIVRDIA